MTFRAMAGLNKKMMASLVKQAREEKGLTQAKLSEAAEVTDETISRLERGAFEPSLTTLIRVADALGLSLDQLVGRDWIAASQPDDPLVKRLSARVAVLTPAAQRLLMGLAEQLPERAAALGEAATEAPERPSRQGASTKKRRARPLAKRR